MLSSGELVNTCRKYFHITQQRAQSNTIPPGERGTSMACLLELFRNRRISGESEYVESVARGTYMRWIPLTTM